MIAQGKFKFKGIQKRDGGSFVNDKGQTINYKESYSLKLDENIESNSYERVFKVPIDSPLINQLQQLKIYEDVTINFDVLMFGTNTKLVPIALVK